MIDTSKIASDILNNISGIKKNDPINLKNIAHNLVSSVSKRKNITHEKTQYSKSGRGRKYCPECKYYVGIRTQKCLCGHEFEFNTDNKVKEKVEQNERISDEDKRYAIAIGANRGYFVFAGSGPVPVQFCCDASNKISSVVNFCEDIVSHGLKDGKIFLPIAIKGYLRHSVENCDEFLDMIDDWYNEKVESTMHMNI